MNITGLKIITIVMSSLQFVVGYFLIKKGLQKGGILGFSGPPH